MNDAMELQDVEKAIEDQDRERLWRQLKLAGSPHYKTGDVEPMDLYRAAGMLRSFALCNIIKYAYRNSNPDEPINADDMKKIVHYAEILRAL